MNYTLLRGCAMLLLLGVSVFGASPADAYNIKCRNPAMSNVVFGNVDPQSSQTDVTATFSLTCENEAPFNIRGATICLSIGEPASGPRNPRQMTDGSANALDFQLYQDPSHSIVWGSQFSGSDEPLIIKISLGAKASMQVNATMFGRVMGSQTTATPGAYSQIYAPTDTRVTVESKHTGGTPPEDCNTSPSGSLYFPFSVSANVVNKCTVTASPLDFGANPGLLSAEVNGSTTLGVQCSVGTAYNVGLDAGQNGGGDINARKMALGSNSVGYQLYRDLARTQVWGTTINSNTVPGTGNGSTQSLTVYGSVPEQTTPPAGTYNDVVTVTVTY